jgi:uncharacterized membrane protein
VSVDVQAIAAALEAFEMAVEVDMREFSSTSAKALFRAEEFLSENERDWLRQLLQERVALQAVVEAAQALCEADDQMIARGIDGGILDMQVSGAVVDALDDMKQALAAWKG